MGIMKSLYADLSCEEVFELDAWCEERREADIAAQDADIAAQDADMVAAELGRQSDAQGAESATFDLLVAAG